MPKTPLPGTPDTEHCVEVDQAWNAVLEAAFASHQTVMSKHFEDQLRLQLQQLQKSLLSEMDGKLAASTLQSTLTLKVPLDQQQNQQHQHQQQKEPKQATPNGFERLQCAPEAEPTLETKVLQPALTVKAEFQNQPMPETSNGLDSLRCASETEPPPCMLDLPPAPGLVPQVSPGLSRSENSLLAQDNNSVCSPSASRSLPLAFDQRTSKHDDLDTSTEVQRPQSKRGSSKNTLQSLKTTTFSKLVRDDGENERFKQSHVVDVVVSATIAIYVLVLFVQAQWRGWQAGYVLKQHDSVEGWPDAETVFYVCDHIFNAIFVLELAARLFMEGLKYLSMPMNLVDVVIVVATSVDAYILTPFSLGQGQNLGVGRLARVFRLARILRVLRIVRMARHLTQLRILSSVLEKCHSPLVWALLVLGIIIVGSGILMTQILTDFVVDGDADYNTRLWVFKYYGDAAKASYSMFEATFSGSWPNLARPLIETVSPWFVVVWIFYQVVVTFAVLRIIGAIFLSETIRAANTDAEAEILVKLKEKEVFADKLRKFFHAADTSGDGALSLEELQLAISEPGVEAWLRALELEIYEVMALFNLLDDNDDGTVSCEEFLGGAVRLKGNARAIDSILIMHEQNKISRRLDEMERAMKQLVASQIPHLS